MSGVNPSGAGSDTTAIALRAIFYYTVKSPRVYQKLVAEIDEFDRNGLLSPLVSFEESLKMPYLYAFSLPVKNSVYLNTFHKKPGSYERSYASPPERCLPA